MYLACKCTTHFASVDYLRCDHDFSGSSLKLWCVCAKRIIKFILCVCVWVWRFKHNAFNFKRIHKQNALTLYRMRKKKLLTYTYLQCKCPSHCIHSHTLFDVNSAVDLRGKKTTQLREYLRCKRTNQVMYICCNLCFCCCCIQCKKRLWDKHYKVYCCIHVIASVN